MVNNGYKDICGLTDERVSYLYDEMSGAERSGFETHLAGCSVCTDEFAAIAEARLSVFEWQKEAFSHLLVPEIAVPYEPKRNVAETLEIGGLLAGLRGFLYLVNLPVAAALLVLVGLCVGLLTIRYKNSPQPIASNIGTQSVAEPEKALVRELSTTLTPPNIPKSANKEVHAFRTVVRLPRVASKQTVARNSETKKSVIRKTVPPLSAAPMLSSYEDSSDSSLRLADLFDDVDG